MLAAFATVTAGCDAGPEHDQAHLNGPPIHLVDANVGAKLDGGANPPLPVDGRVEVSFDRFLLPQSVSRQTFILQDAQGNFLNPSVAYDPAARVVTLTTMTTPFMADQTYSLRIVPPANAHDVNGLRAVDGTPLAQTIALSFQVAGPNAGPGATQTPVPQVDFCKDVFPIFGGRCSIPGTCHAPDPRGSAEGLYLNSSPGILATAIGVPSHEANTGTRSVAQEPGANGSATLFGGNMPIVDPGSGGGVGGNSANSWLMYKVLLVQPSPVGATGTTMPSITMAAAHLVATQDASEADRTALGDLMQGREMPFPSMPGMMGPGASPAPLTDDELEAVSLWISQVPPNGMIVPPCQ